MKVPTTAIILVRVEVRTAVLEAGVEVQRRAQDPLEDRRVAHLAEVMEAVQEVGLGNLALEDLLVLVEPALECEEASVEMMKATVQV